MTGKNTRNRVVKGANISTKGYARPDLGDTPLPLAKCLAPSHPPILPIVSTPDLP